MRSTNNIKPNETTKFIYNVIESLAYAFTVEIPGMILVLGLEAAIITVSTTLGFPLGMPLPTMKEALKAIALDAVIQFTVKDMFKANILQIADYYNISNETKYYLNLTIGTIGGMSKYTLKNGNIEISKAIQGGINGLLIALDPKDEHVVITEVIDSWKDISDRTANKVIENLGFLRGSLLILSKNTIWACAIDSLINKVFKGNFTKDLLNQLNDLTKYITNTMDDNQTDDPTKQTTGIMGDDQICLDHHKNIYLVPNYWEYDLTA